MLCGTELDVLLLRAGGRVTLPLLLLPAPKPRSSRRAAASDASETMKNKDQNPHSGMHAAEPRKTSLTTPSNTLDSRLDSRMWRNWQTRQTKDLVE